MEKYSGRIQHGVEIRTLAQAAGLGEYAMAETLDNLINKGYLQHARQQGENCCFNSARRWRALLLRRKSL